MEVKGKITTPRTPIEKTINTIQEPGKMSDDQEKIAEYVDNHLKDLPDKVTEEMLRDARKKVIDLEDGRPRYDPEDLSLLTNNITWAYNLLIAYQELDVLLCAKIRDDKADGIQAEDLENELGEIRKKVHDLLLTNNNIWEDFRKLSEKQEAEEKEREKGYISLGSRRLTTFTLPTDKINRTAWTRGEIEGKKDFTIKVEKEGSHKKIDIPFSLDLTKIQETCPQLKELDCIDKRVWTISDALYRDGQDIVTYNQIYKYIGHENNKTTGGGNVVDEAYTKLNAEIFFDNQEEIDAGYHYRHFRYRGPILANERLTTDDPIVLINGKKTDNAIHILSRSRLLDFAIDRGDNRGQIAELPVEVYQTPLKLTAQNAEIEDYFLTWLIRALDSNKTNNHSLKMDTIYRRFKMTGKTAADRKRRERLREKIIALFDFYRSLELTVNGRQLDRVTMDDSLTLHFKKVDG